MTHPKSESILRVIDAFKKVLPMAIRGDHLNMNQSNVNCGYGCGTVHCHGGWFTVAVCDLTKHVGYSQGANKMAQWLGFTEKDDIAAWAYKNQEIWGNGRGMGMFCDKTAFIHQTKRPAGAENLQHIIDHWTEVYERVKAIEKQQSKEQEVKEPKEKIRYVGVPVSITEQSESLILN